MAKKNQPLFSTDTGVDNRKSKKKQDPNKKIASGPIKCRLEKKGRGGKTVTIFYDLPLTIQEAKKLLKELKGEFACGGTFKNNEIIISGNLSEKSKEIISKYSK